MLVECRGLKFRYPGSVTPVINDFSVRFSPRAVTAVIGPSGSGKSTLLDIIGGLQHQWLGEVWLGSVLAARSDLQAATAWIAQTTPMLPGRSAAENAGLGLIARGATPRYASAAAALALAEFGLGGRASEPIQRLSGGEVQRVAVVRCLLSWSPVVLADEPTGHLDADNTSKVTEAFKTLARSGKTVIVATHDPAVWEQADEIVDLRR